MYVSCKTTWLDWKTVLLMLNERYRDRGFPCRFTIESHSSYNRCIESDKIMMVYFDMSIYHNIYLL